jgi:hypothetical protein
MVKRSLQKQAVMKKTLQLLMPAIMLFMLTSCFSTRYVSNEADLKRDYMGAYVEDVEFEFGEPDEVTESPRGYAYVYNEKGGIGTSSKMVDQYIRFSFNNKDAVRDVQSSTTKRIKAFSPAKTFVGLPAIIIFSIIVPAVIVVVGLGGLE